MFNRQERPRKKKKAPLLRLLLLTAVLLILIRIGFNDELKTVHYSVSSSLVEGDHVFAVVSDLHATAYGDNQRELTEQVLASGAEAVLIPGDLLDHDRPDDESRAFIKQIRSAGLPIYLSTGNHECSLMQIHEMRSWCEENDVTLLSGESVMLPGNICLYGVDDPNYLLNEMTEDEGMEFLRSLNPAADTFDLLLAHRPEYAEQYASAGFDLTVCGHAHGGQIRIPVLINGLFSPGEGWLPKYAGGKYDFNGRTVLVSRGLMRNDVPRVFNRPELLIVEIKGK